MDQAEYDRKFKKPGIIVGSENDEGFESLDSEPIIVDGTSVAPLNIKVINSTPQDQHAKDMESLEENVQVIGYTENGTQIIRRTGGPDYAGNDQWRSLMQRLGRLKQ